MLSNFDTHASGTSMLNDLGLECLEDRRRIAWLTLMYKVLHGHVGISPEDINVTFSSTHTRAAVKLQHQRSFTTQHCNWFTICTIPEWNLLPASVAEAGSINQFKSQLASLAH